MKVRFFRDIFRPLFGIIKRMLIKRANVLFGTRFYEYSFIYRSSSEVFNELDNLELPHRRWLADNIIKYCEPNYPGATCILELGCGWGPNLITISNLVNDISLVGLDINRHSIKIGREVLTKLNICNVELRQMKASDLVEIKENFFDIVFTDAVLLYIAPDQIEKVIKNLIRIARKKYFS